MSKTKFNIGDKVFAKLRGYCPWPAKIEGVADSGKNQVKYHVYFYGTKQIAVCREEDVFNYNENKYKFGKPKNIKYFNASITEIELDTELSSPATSVQNTNKSSNISLGKPHSHLITDEPGTNSKPRPTEKLFITDNVNEQLNQYKWSALKIEERLTDIQYKIEKHLGLKQVYPKLCLKYLDELFNLKINALMVKKHPEVLDLLDKLQNYEGNLEAWNFSEEKKNIFLRQAALIRSKANVVDSKIQSLFIVPDGMAFRDFFNKEMITFENITKELSMAEYYSLI